jgi:hypothetical protein
MSDGLNGAALWYLHLFILKEIYLDVAPLFDGILTFAEVAL